MRTALALIAGLLLVGCDPVPGADRDEVAGPPSAGRETIQPASPAASRAGQVSLGDRLSCRETDLFAQPVAVQAARLTHGAALTCGVQVEGPFAACTGDGRLRLFGLPVLAVSVMAEGIEQGLQIRFRGDAASVATAAGRALGVPLRRRFGEPGYSYDGLGVDALDYYVLPREPGEAAFGCTLPAPAGDAALPPLPRPDGWALLSGSVSYPGGHDLGEHDPGQHVPAAMRVCAIDADDSGRGHCVLTTEGNPHYRLPVPPGHWWLLAWPQGTGSATEPGRHSAASGCITEQRTGCDDHGLRAIVIGANEHRGGLSINDWYADPRTDPPPPPLRE